MDKEINYPQESGETQEFTCDRCGFKYQKKSDYLPYLCYRCLRFLAKNVWKISKQIQPATSRPEVSGV